VKRGDSSGKQSEELPQPPSIVPKIHLSWKQRLGVPVLLAIPILALFGIFGERTAATHVTTSSLDMVVSYPSRLHYRQVQSLQVSIRNLSARVLDTVSVVFDTAYVSRFTGVKFEPPAESPYTVDLTSVKPGESRLVSIELWGQDYGRHRATIVARTGSDSAMVRFTTIVFP
jgi:hypothetical protein